MGFPNTQKRAVSEVDRTAPMSLRELFKTYLNEDDDFDGVELVRRDQVAVVSARGPDVVVAQPVAQPIVVAQAVEVSD